jgi:two-component system, cell cycle response regulator
LSDHDAGVEPSVTGDEGLALESTFSKTIRVLVAEDTESQRLVLAKQVRSLGFEVMPAADGEEALAKFEQFRPHVLLTDWFMPKVDGIDVCRFARASDRGMMIYIIMLTAHGDEDRLVEAFDAGADDFLNKPVNVRELQARMRAGKRIIALQTERNAENLRVLNAELSAANRRLFDFAHLDALTGLANRRLIVERLQQEWSAHARHQVPLSVILLDVDHFKKVNDEHGHDMGDAVLSRIAQVLRRETRAEDTVARFGGEEFLILTRDADLASAALLAERVRAAVAREQFTSSDRSWSITASFGVATTDPETESWDSLLKRADIALYQAKGDGRNLVRG